MIKKQLIKKYIKKKFRYLKYLLNYNLWAQVSILDYIESSLFYNLKLFRKFFFIKKLEFVKNQN